MTNGDKRVARSVSMEEFNKQVGQWSFATRQKVLARLGSATTGDASGKGKRSLRVSMKKDFGEVFSTGFKFNFYLVFIHYGVGRGYVRRGGTVVRGHRTDNNKWRMYRGKEARTVKDYGSDLRPVLRRGFDWLDVEIRRNIDKLADIAAAYHGDKAAKEVAEGMYKMQIEKSNGR